jgi:hypothetical protein
MLADNLYEADTGLFRGEVVEIMSLGEFLGSTRRAWRLVHELEVTTDTTPGLSIEPSQSAERRARDETR